MARTAALVIIGNEILTGKVVDVNIPFLTQGLWGLGVRVCRIAVIPDEVARIAEEVAATSGSHDVVITTGGVGPTHDDVTMEGVARAFGRGVVGHPDLLAMLRAYFKTDTLTAPQARLADVPEGARLVTADGMRYPQVVMENVFIFPGVPTLVREKFTALADFFRGDAPFYLRQLRLAGMETDLAPLLDTVVAAWPTVSIGSYPQEEGAGFDVLITLESSDEGALEGAYHALQQAVTP
ncbi:MAG TPA: molybdopterin-binding protein [Candidatus Xenobia bacterium]